MLVKYKRVVREMTMFRSEDSSSKVAEFPMTTDVD